MLHKPDCGMYFVYIFYTCVYTCVYICGYNGAKMSAFSMLIS